MQCFDPTGPRKNGPWAGNTSSPRDEEFIWPILDLSPCVGVPSPV